MKHPPAEPLGDSKNGITFLEISEMLCHTFFDTEESNARNKQRIINNFGRYYLRKPLLSVILCVQRRTVKDGV